MMKPWDGGRWLHPRFRTTSRAAEPEILSSVWFYVATWLVVAAGGWTDIDD